MDFHVRSGFGHVQVTLCTKRRNFMDFEPKIAPIHEISRKRNAFECNSLPGSVQNNAQKSSKNAKSVKIRENPRTSRKSAKYARYFLTGRLFKWTIPLTLECLALAAVLGSCNISSAHRMVHTGGDPS